MPAPIPVRLAPHDPCWAEQANAEADRILSACGVIHVHHIGSTAIPGIVAKPVLDLLGIAEDADAIDAGAAGLQSLGYVPHGQYGLAGRRYFTLDDGGTGERRVQLHCYARGDLAIARHLAFRDYLRVRRDLAQEYEREKVRCAGLHRKDSHA